MSQPNDPAKSTVSPANPGAGNSPASKAEVPQKVETLEELRKRRKPMSAPVRRLETTTIPGFHLHWFREQNIPRAENAGYRFVLTHEVEINTRNVSLPSEMGSTADLSNRVTVQYGGDTLYLMKLPEELYKEDMAIIAARNAEVWKQIFRGEQLAGQQERTPGDTSNRYLKEASASGSDLARAALRRDNKPLFARTYKASTTT